jgi:hypothetical protein
MWRGVWSQGQARTRKSSGLSKAFISSCLVRPLHCDIWQLGLAMRGLGRFVRKPPVIGVESGYGCLIVEMGIGGFLPWVVMSLAITVSA